MNRLKKSLALAGLIPVLASGYMLYESQWLRCREERLPVPDLPRALDGCRVLHISDVHAGQPGLNIRTLRKALEWASKKDPDLVVLTGDILGAGRGSLRCLELLRGLEAPLGKFAVAGNHEYGLSKNPFAHTQRFHDWAAAGITLLQDRCVEVKVGGGPGDSEAGSLAVCGADYLTGGYGLRDAVPEEADYAMLLVHRPPVSGEEPSGRFPLAFSGHTHGGQIRFPGPHGPVAIHKEGLPYISGVNVQGDGVVVISVGIGTTFLPFRLLTRPEMTIYELVSDEAAGRVSSIHDDQTASTGGGQDDKRVPSRRGSASGGHAGEACLPSGRGKAPGR